MAEPFKTCPICASANHRNATVCITCGTTLSAVKANKSAPALKIAQNDYDYRYGETDLSEANLRRTARLFLLGIVLLAAGVCAALLIIAFQPQINTFFTRQETQNPAVILTNTVPPTRIFATVTQGPPTVLPTPTPTLSPTPTITPTPEPCMQRVNVGDDLITLAFNCGHRSLAVLDEILRLNNLQDASRIQAGQTLIIPWPTPTPDPNPTETPTAEIITGSTADETAENNGSLAVALEVIDPFAPTATKTLQPGVMWHQVVSGENILVIALTYGANVEILSQLNPEVTFSQCDFSLASGGGTCRVNLFEGQLLRVPAPTPTPTLSPTPSGSETPTPTATATFNAPSPYSPADRALFLRDELVTLRWVATGTLTADQTYRLVVTNLATGVTYTADTRDLFFIIPLEWQGLEDKRYQYRWTVSIISLSEPDRPYYTTQPLTFIWQGRGGV